ncbi:hypothetical protein GCM10008106_22600 [Mongoliitalea lutea]|uniref:LTD domain-containing protein n=2 Tax=Mongoliitalea lutea TaxID=849756 RepID=A0A8J3CZ69_9BACT|nr:hypothetical protein GCM10008106_22600 [Mongoliitalea lutea]
MSSNSTTIADEDGDYEDWIELYNYGNEAINLNGFGISDNPNNPFKWVLPDITMAPDSFLLVWASDKNRTNPESALHTNFKISASGEHLSLTHPNGTLIDSIEEVSVPTDVSYGRGLNDNFNNYFFFYTPTPNEQNTTIGSSELIVEPIFSHSSGFYDSEFTLTISHPNPNALIIYTVDGSDPKPENIGGTTYQYKNQYPQSPGQQTGPLITNSFETLTYSNPVVIQDRTSQPNKLATISSTWHFNPNYFPNQPIKKATIVKARAYVNGILSPLVSHTFFVSSTNAFQSNLPIISISLNEADLFDYENGIYVAGVDFDNWRIANPTQTPTGGTASNYRRSGEEHEINGHIIYFVDKNEKLSQNIGLRINGGFSRSRPLKSFRLYARSEYGQNTLDYPFFENYNFSSFKRLLLRNSGNDENSTLFRDAFIQNLVSHLNFDTQQYQPILHYINGEFWGIINIRERYDKHYLNRVYNLEENEIDLLENNAEVNEGDNLHWNSVLEFLSQNDLSTESNYKQIQTLIDIDNYTDYWISQTFVRNTDWPHNNIRYFRKKTSYSPNAPVGHDGRWRWLMYDTDFGFGLNSQFGGTFEKDMIAWVTNPNGNDRFPNQPWINSVMVSLIKNEVFKTSFILRYADLLNTAFLPQRSIDLINEMKNVIEPEIPAHRNRWRNRIGNWQNNINRMIEFANKRPDFVRQHIIDNFNLSGSYQLTIDVAETMTDLIDENQPSVGYVKLNTIDLTDATPGISSNTYPWTGTYFNELPVTLTAIPLEGYTFSHWSGAIESTESSITLNLNEDSQVTAHFMKAADSEDAEVIHFWLMGNDIPNNTPLTSLTATFTQTNESGTINFESALEGYPFDNGHPNWRKASMERRNSPTPLNYFPEANNGLAFEDITMRGLQIKQPFEDGDRQNTIFFKVSTQGFENIKLSFAVLNEGAADGIIVSYFDPASSSWTDTDLPTTSATISTTYQVVEFDFSNVSVATNNPDLQIRLRFTGNNLADDNGDRVTFNNIAFTGTPITKNQTIVHYWVMDNNIPNNTPLTSLTATFTQTDELGVINFESALEGYPFENGHPNWRKASMERRNSPTPLNYFPEANNGLAFEDFTMRGLQIKQPFEDGDRQNTLFFKASTQGFENVKLSFAVLDEGAADGITVSYFDQTTSTWTDSDLPTSVAPLSDSYQVVEFDFSNVIIATNNPELQIRLRFTGSNLTIDDGDRVTFNNIAITGSPFIPSESPVITSTTPASRCDAGSVTLLATSNGGTIHWFETPEGGEAIATGESFTTPVLTETTIYYVEAIGNESAGNGTRTAVPATINILPEITATISAELCGEGSVDLEASSNIGVINWYISAEGGTPIHTGNRFITPILKNNTTYYVEAVNEGCVSLRVPVNAIVEDQINPEIVATSTYTLMLDTDGKATLSWEDIDEGSTDNCEITERIISKNSFDCSDLGELTVDYLIRDAAGNESSAPIVVTIVDEIKPEIRAKSTYTLMLDADGKATLSWEDIDEGSSDNCGITERILSKTDFSRDDNGERIITYTIKDSSGNTATTEITLTVDIILSLGNNNPEQQGDIKLFPNPTKDDLFIEFEKTINLENVSIEVIDASGRSMGESTNFQQSGTILRLDTSRLSSGVYFLRISSERSLKVMKFIIKR